MLVEIVCVAKRLVFVIVVMVRVAVCGAVRVGVFMLMVMMVVMVVIMTVVEVFVFDQLFIFAGLLGAAAATCAHGGLLYISRWRLVGVTDL